MATKAKNASRHADSPRVRHVHSGDLVIVISGNDKGRTGRVKRVDHGRGRVLVEGVNLRWKHKRGGGRPDQKGERVQEECAIHASNVQPVDPETGKGTRRHTRRTKGND